MAQYFRMAVGYGPIKKMFTLRTISVAEENRYGNQFLTIPVGATEEQKAEKEYEIVVNGIAEFSTEAPYDCDEAGKRLDAVSAALPEGADLTTPAEAVRKYFENYTPERQREAYAIMSRYRTRLQPDVIFY